MRRIQDTFKPLEWKYLISAVKHFEKERPIDDYASETV